MSNVLRGAVTRLILDGSPVSGETRCSLSLTMHTHQYASFEDIQWHRSMTDIASWNVTAEGLLSDATAAMLASLLIQPAEHSVSMSLADTTAPSGTTTLTGTVIPTDLKLSAPVKGTARWSLTLQGTGPIG